MTNHPRHDDVHKIVILNPKGGSGKTTLATNIASALALRGPPPTLVDCDPQGYSLRWLQNRPSARPAIHGMAASRYGGADGNWGELESWAGSRHLIVDLPASLPDDRLYYQVYDANSIVIPVLPSHIDIYSASRFIANLLLVAQVDRRSRNIAIVANRTRKHTNSLRMLRRFLSSLEIPLIAELRDSQNYVHAAGLGLGVSELPAHRAAQDAEQLQPVIDWLDNWRMRLLDAAATTAYEHVPNTEVLTPKRTGPYR